MIECIKVLETNTADELITVLEKFKDKTVTIFGTGLPIYVHIEDDMIILDEKNLEELESSHGV